MYVYIYIYIYIYIYMHIMEEGMMSGFCVRTSAGVGGGKYCVRSSSKGSMSTSTTNGSGTKCGRWNPTAEQVKVLTELFRSGLRTPTTDQIQKISTQLSFYGKIESKNVFYWFQNHKARERQKRRKVSFHDSNNNNLLITTTSDKENCFNLSTQRFGEMYQQVSKPDRVIETLQLFPLNSFGESESENNTHKLRVHANDHHQYHCRVDDVMFSSYTMAEQMEHPPLDLRLSFM